MIAVKPVNINRSKVAYTNAVDQPEFDSETTYSIGAEVKVNDEAFKSLADTNLGNSPKTSPLWWESSGFCNQMAMFDNSPATLTVGPTINGEHQVLTVGLRPGIRCSAIGLLRVSGSVATVKVYNFQGGELIHQDTAVLSSTLGTYYSWCFETLQQTPDVVFWDMAATNDPYVEISISPAAGGPAQVGLAVIGRQTSCGKAEYGFSQGTELRGRSYIDKQGNPVRLERGFRKTISGTILVNNRGGVGFAMSSEVSYNRVQNFLSENVGVPMLWVLDKDLDDYRSAAIFGDYERTVMSIDNLVISKLSIDINGYF